MLNLDRRILRLLLSSPSQFCKRQIKYAPCSALTASLRRWNPSSPSPCTTARLKCWSANTSSSALLNQSFAFWLVASSGAKLAPIKSMASKRVYGVLWTLNVGLWMMGQFGYQKDQKYTRYRLMFGGLKNWTQILSISDDQVMVIELPRLGVVVVCFNRQTSSFVTPARGSDSQLEQSVQPSARRPEKGLDGSGFSMVGGGISRKSNEIGVAEASLSSVSCSARSAITVANCLTSYTRIHSKELRNPVTLVNLSRNWNLPNLIVSSVSGG